jgi:glycosyltransferase involved in cell wall biosynthesis
VIGAQLIVGDLPEPFLEAALRSVEWVDYVVVVPVLIDAGVGAGDPLGLLQNLQIIRDTVPADKLRIDQERSAGEPDFAAARNAALAQVPDGDHVLILDADDVHYPEWEGICHYYLLNGADSITAAFYHFVVYRDAVQAVFPREIVFRKTAETQFVGRVHEQLSTPRRQPVDADYRYCHFGYLRPQANVFERWRRYSVIEGEPNHYAGQDPEHIIDDRVSVATRFDLDYPPAVTDLIEQYPDCPVQLQGETEPPAPSVGLVLLAKDDAALLPGMFESLRATHGQFDVAMIDIGSTDDTQQLLAQAASESLTGFAGTTLSVVRLLPATATLCEALNAGFRWFRDQRYDFIGWIHPDMRFEDPAWLAGLLHELHCWPRLGKVCAANTRDRLPDEITDGQEQCYLVRTSVLDEIGLFDEGYVGIGGYEDWDMNRRIVNAGYRVVITPRAQVFHEGMATRSRRDTTAEQVANAEYYERKWGSRDPVV